MYKGFIDPKKVSQGDKMSKIRIALFLILIISVAYGAFLYSRFQTLEAAFLNLEQYLPTRIYSDVIRIHPGLRRKAIKARLKSLKYEFSESGNVIQFTLRDQPYPETLLPGNHPTSYVKGKPLVLMFDSPEQASRLVSITTQEYDVPEIYLEPQIMATLRRAKRTENSNEIRRLLSFEEIPASVWQSIIAVEDQHFLEHHGLDPRGFARAMWVNLKTFSLSQGGSTITQQLVKNLMSRRTKNIFKKVNEIFLSLLLELKFDKEQILERYLNEVYLGQIGNLEIHGVAEGAKYFFGKTLDELNIGEIALLSGLIRGPGYYSPYQHFDRAIERQRFILDKMVENKHIAPEEAQLAKEQPIRLVPPPRYANKAPYFTDYVKAQVIEKLKNEINEAEIPKAGLKIYTTLDPILNRHAQNIVDDRITKIEKRFGVMTAGHLEGALASVDHKTGYIRTLIGGRNYRRSTFNRILNMKRQVGSTFKPLVYLAAIQKGFDQKGVVYGPGYPVADEPWTLNYDRGKQSWSPDNYEKEYRGWISMREALIHSINIPAAKIGSRVGIQRVIDTAQQLGIRSKLPKVPSLALGVVELSPVELLKVYATIANRGIQDELTTIRAITKNDDTLFAEFIYHPQEVFDPRYMDLLTHLLKGVFTEGTARMAKNYGFNQIAAGKTGTTNDHRDAWFAGFTGTLTTVVWVGIEKGKASVRLTGSGSALPIWIDYMKKAQELLDETPLKESEFLEEIRINRPTGLLATDDCPPEWVTIQPYLIGESPTEEACVTEWPKAEAVTEIQ